MSTGLRFLVSMQLLLSLAAIAMTQDAPLAIPDTPAGKQLSSWLAAFNTGKIEVLREFISTHFGPPPNGPLPVDQIASRQLGLFTGTGGFDVLQIVQPSSASIVAMVKAKKTGFWMKIQIFITAKAPEWKVAEPPFQIVGFGFSSAPAPPELLPRKKLSESEVRKRVDDLVNQLVARDQFSGVILIGKGDKPIYSRATGLASRAWNIRNRVDTKFNLASITKMFTAVAIAQLVEQGKLSYSDTVGKILPDYPNKDVANRVTVHHLLSHTSGLDNAQGLVEKSISSPEIRTVAGFQETFVNNPLRFDPGSRFDYSNSGFILLGALIEKASGQDYYTYMREHVFRPAGMANSDFYSVDSDTPNLAEGFEDGPNGVRRNNILALGFRGIPSGGAYSTAEDMLKFSVALRTHKLVSQKTIEQMWTGVKDQPGRGQYGYGSAVRQYNGSRIVGHGGGWRGITNQYEIYADLGYTVVILCNIDNDPNSIAYKISEWLTQNPNNVGAK
jgi:CubicO group peptidase (beta-lactamase class C family)